MPYHCSLFAKNVHTDFLYPCYCTAKLNSRLKGLCVNLVRDDYSPAGWSGVAVNGHRKNTTKENQDPHYFFLSLKQTSF